MKSISGHIETRESFPSEDELVREYVDRSRPVIFTGVADTLPACRKWSLGWLEREHGSEIGRAHV